MKVEYCCENFRKSIEWGYFKYKSVEDMDVYIFDETHGLWGERLQYCPWCAQPISTNIGSVESW